MRRSFFVFVLLASCARMLDLDVPTEVEYVAVLELDRGSLAPISAIVPIDELPAIAGREVVVAGYSRAQLEELHLEPESKLAIALPCEEALGAPLWNTAISASGVLGVNDIPIPRLTSSVRACRCAGDIDPADFELYTYEIPDTIDAITSFAAAAISDREIILAIGEHTFVRANKDGFHPLDLPANLPSDAIYSTPDYELWLASASGSIYRGRLGHGFELLERPHGGGIWSADLFGGDGELFFATDAGAIDEYRKLEWHELYDRSDFTIARGAWLAPRKLVVMTASDRLVSYDHGRTTALSPSVLGNGGYISAIAAHPALGFVATGCSESAGVQCQTFLAATHDATGPVSSWTPLGAQSSGNGNQDPVAVLAAYGDGVLAADPLGRLVWAAPNGVERRFDDLTALARNIVPLERGFVVISRLVLVPSFGGDGSQETNILVTFGVRKACAPSP